MPYFTSDGIQVTKTLKNALDFLEDADESNQLVMRTRGTCYFHLASIESYLQGANVGRALLDSKRAILWLLRATEVANSNVSDLQIVCS